MRRFDGVAVLALDTAASRPWPASPGETLLGEDGRRFVVACRPGLPAALLDTQGRRIAVVGLRAEAAPAPTTTAGFHGPGSRPTRPRVSAILPPASSAGLVGCRPLAGGRTHVALFGQGMTLCGRLPVTGEPADPGLVDCLRCRRSEVLGERFARQLADHDRLLEVVDPLTAAALAGWWPRLDHRDPTGLPVLLDAMVGARVHGLPGAPSTDEVLRQVRRHRATASGPVRAWAAEQARPRLEQQLRRLVVDTRAANVATVRHELALAGGLLDVADVAETLVALLEQHGPVPSLEPLVLEAARRAGDRASDRVRRWRRLHAVAAALTPPGHPARPHPISHGDRHAGHRTPTGNPR